MKNLKFAGMLLSVLLLSQAPALAGDHASCDEAMAMAVKAADYYKTNGAEKAWEHFMAKPAEFFDRDLYVFAFDTTGKYAVHATKPVMVGKNGMDFKDATGFQFIKAMTEVKAPSWIDYKYPDPSDGNKVKDKKSYVTPVDNYIIGVGCYVEK